MGRAGGTVLLRWHFFLVCFRLIFSFSCILRTCIFVFEQAWSFFVGHVCERFVVFRPVQIANITSPPFNIYMNIYICIASRHNSFTLSNPFLRSSIRSLLSSTPTLNLNNLLSHSESLIYLHSTKLSTPPKLVA
jgi:hypothetical protein